MKIIMNSNGDNESPWNNLRCMEISPNVSLFDRNTVFQLSMLRPNNRRILSGAPTTFSVFFNQEWGTMYYAFL